jgi:hypothetical protein
MRSCVAPASKVTKTDPPTGTSAANELTLMRSTPEFESTALALCVNMTSAMSVPVTSKKFLRHCLRPIFENLSSQVLGSVETIIGFILLIMFIFFAPVKIAATGIV